MTCKFVFLFLYNLNLINLAMKTHDELEYILNMHYLSPGAQWTKGICSTSE